MENWKAVPGFSDYEVSDHGRVKRATSSKGTKPGKILKQHLSRRWYVRLSSGPDIVTKYYVHRLVLLAFVGPCAEGREVNHKDCDPANNHLSNLEYVTRSENCLHAHAAGVAHSFPCGDEHPHCRITDADVKRLRRLSGRKTTKQLAEMFGVSTGHVRKIVRGDTR